MAKRDHTRDRPVHESMGKQERFLTVAMYPEPIPHLPWIRLRGLWLLQAGFAPRMRVRVRIMRGCLVITTD